MRVPSDSSPPKELYTPKGFFAHAVSLHQGFPHCARFPTAASRRSLGRVSVPVWPCVLSDRLPIFALVGRHPANKLIGRGPLLQRIAPLIPPTGVGGMLCGISPGFPGLSPTRGQVAHVLLTRAPLYSSAEADFLARLACVRRAASVDSEPGSNSRCNLLSRAIAEQTCKNETFRPAELKISYWSSISELSKN